MELIIKSRKLNSTIIFSRPHTHYIYVNLTGAGGAAGLLGEQICVGGRTTGSTIGYTGEDQGQFEKICRRWYKAYIRLTDEKDAK